VSGAARGPARAMRWCSPPHSSARRSAPRASSTSFDRVAGLGAPSAQAAESAADDHLHLHLGLHLHPDSTHHVED
jgi:hypothetical protein